MAKRIIVVSDSHGDADGLHAAFAQAARHGKIDAAVFLGDGTSDFEQVKPSLCARGTICYAVKGNNDWVTQEPAEALFTVGGVRFFACHGHTRQVKYGLERVWYAAREHEAQVAFYGHTHCESITQEAGVQLVNPGAVCERSKRRSAYAEAIVEDSGLVNVRLVPWEA